MAARVGGWKEKVAEKFYLSYLSAKGEGEEILEGGFAHLLLTLPRP